MTEPGSEEFYLEQAARVARLAALANNDVVRGELEEMAAMFYRLAERENSRASGKTA